MAISEAMIGAAAVIAVLMAFTWLVSIPAKNVSIVDIVWGLGFAFVALSVAIRSSVDESPTVRSGILVAMVVLWGVRLGGYLALRNSGMGEDRRYVAMRSKFDPGFWWKSLFVVFVLQGVMMWVVSSPVQVALSQMAEAASSKVTAFDVIGVALWLLGIVFETVGDAQLARFKEDPANAGAVMDRGLWKYTRHPNYFGDFCVWWGIYFVCANVPAARWGVVGPLLMTWLLTRVSGVPLLERSLATRRPGYAEYIERTSGFFPRRPRSQ